MSAIIIVLTFVISSIIFFLINKNGKDKVKLSIKIYSLVFVVLFLLWLFLPLIIFNYQQDSLFSELLNKTALPPTTAKILATLFAVSYVAIIWYGKWEAKPMSIVYGTATPIILMLLMQNLFPNLSTGCKAINPDTGKYEFCECEYLNKIHPIWQTPVIKNDGILTRINADENTVLFDKKGTALFFYTKDSSGIITLFDQEGFTPTGDKTEKLTPEVAKIYLTQIKISRNSILINEPPKDNPIGTNQSSLPANPKGRSNTSQKEIIKISSEQKDYLIISLSNSNIPGLLEEIKATVETKGNTTSISNNKKISYTSLKGQFKKVISLNGSLLSRNNTIDETTLSSTYSYTVTIYDIETSKTIEIKKDKISVVGFSENENISKIITHVTNTINDIL